MKSMNNPGFDAERDADEAAEKALDDLDGLDLLSDPEFAGLGDASRL